MSQLTLQINSLEALERLIGNDTQAEIDIRNSVVQKFATKHLKAVANSDQVTRAMTDIRNDIQKQIATQLEQGIGTFKTEYWGGISNVKLRPEIAAQIDNKVHGVLDEIVRKAVDAAIVKWTGTGDLETRIQKRVDYYTQEKINQEIKSRLEKIKASL